MSGFFLDERRLYCWLDCSTASGDVGAEARITWIEGCLKTEVYAYFSGSTIQFSIAICQLGQMITANALQRVFHISYGGNSATGFVLDIDERQYLVTAAHVIGEDASGQIELEFMFNGGWHGMPAEVVGIAAYGADIAVLALPRLLALRHLTLPIADSYGVGQEVHFIGFPHGLHMQLGSMNNFWPTGFVKRGIISAFNNGGKPSIVYLDAINNPGFSGGPVVAKRPGTQEYEVLAVISNYHIAPGQVLRHGHPDRELEIEVNTGIVEAYGIMHAREIVRANPIGRRLGA